MTRTLSTLTRIATALLLCAAVSACSAPVGGGSFPSQTYSSASITASPTTTSIMDY